MPNKQDDATDRRLILRLLPAKELLSGKSLAIDAYSSLAEGIAAIPESLAAWDALVAGNPDVAAEKIYALLTNERTIEAIVQWAVKFGADHGVSTLTTWRGIRDECTDRGLRRP